MEIKNFVIKFIAILVGILVTFFPSKGVFIFGVIALSALILYNLIRNFSLNNIFFYSVAILAFIIIIIIPH